MSGRKKNKKPTLNEEPRPDNIIQTELNVEIPVGINISDSDIESEEPEVLAVSEESKPEISEVKSESEKKPVSKKSGPIKDWYNHRSKEKERKLREQYADLDIDDGDMTVEEHKMNRRELSEKLEKDVEFKAKWMEAEKKRREEKDKQELLDTIAELNKSRAKCDQLESPGTNGASGLNLPEDDGEINTELDSQSQCSGKLSESQSSRGSSNHQGNPTQGVYIHNVQQLVINFNFGKN
jgi:hypothetical protein